MIGLKKGNFRYQNLVLLSTDSALLVLPEITSLFTGKLFSLGVRTCNTEGTNPTNPTNDVDFVEKDNFIHGTSLHCCLARCLD